METAQIKKFEISRQEYLKYKKSAWEDVVTHASTVDDEGGCEGMEKVLTVLTSYSLVASALTSEAAMNGIIENNIFIVLLLYGSKFHRNVQSESSGTKRPDYFIAPNGPPMFVGEDKLYFNYKKGVYGMDPVLENEEKTAWESWQHIWGDIPYIFAYSALADSTRLDFTLGVLVREEKKFVPLGTFNLINASEIPQLWAKFMKLLPVFKALNKMSRETKTCTVPYEDTRTSDMYYGKMVRITKKIASINQRAVFQKSWKFSTNQEAKIFLESQKHVFQLLKSKKSFIQESKEYGFCCDAKDKSLVKVCFEPFGEMVGIYTANDLLTAVLSISKAVSVLHSNRIVHNDIRWDNVIVYKSDYILIDFDDAFILSDTVGSCPSLPHLSGKNHPELTFQDHCFEVDVWAIGKLIVTANVEPDLELKRLGLKIMQSYNTTSVSDVIHELETLRKGRYYVYLFTVVLVYDKSTCTL